MLNLMAFYVVTCDDRLFFDYQILGTRLSLVGESGDTLDILLNIRDKPPPPPPIDDSEKK